MPPGAEEGPCVADESKPITDATPVDGAAKQRVRGRVTLARKVANPEGVKVILFSNKDTPSSRRATT